MMMKDAYSHKALFNNDSDPNNKVDMYNIKLKYPVFFVSVFCTIHGVSAQDNIQKTHPFIDEKILPQISDTIEQTPTILPKESDHKIVPPQEFTEDLTWADQKQKIASQKTDQLAQKIDDWFGETDPNRPATATLRLLFDHRWDDYEGYQLRPRIRGKIRLPTLENKFSVVFGDDTLDNELENNIAITNENQTADRGFDKTRSREDNSSLAIRWNELSNYVPFETDLDLGIRSGDDFYLRLKASKDWQLVNDFSLLAEQIYRYGIDSKNYFRTNLEVKYHPAQSAFLANQLSLTFADEQIDDMQWENFSFRQHQFFHGNRFNYGLYSAGYANDTSLHLNSWGPFISWRQPFLREWFYLQTDLNYLNDERKGYKHHAGALVRMEVIF